TEIQDAIQRLLQNSLNSQKEINTAPVAVNMLPYNIGPSSQITSGVSVQAIQIAELFKEMVSCITHCMDTGIQQTTFALDSPEFSKSLFFGAKITITEYSTAPKIYNIELAASPEALEVFQASASELMAAFQKGKFDFEINRIETNVSEKPFFQKGKIVPPIDKEKGRNL
ncbi:MAG TPA: hypothetical protein VLG76_01000, partial [Rhabdochlamydiaceae bacterium]|nr:hypothetical protein [Rhabdochlamydiaceae bacterium]